MRLRGTEEVDDVGGQGVDVGVEVQRTQGAEGRIQTAGGLSFGKFIRNSRAAFVSSVSIFSWR